MNIVFCDNHLLVVCKPAGLCTQPSTQEDNLTDQAKAWVKARFHKPGQVFLEPIHRLDKPVSGLVLFARTSKALSRLQEQMRSLRIEKTYFALVEGSPPQEDGILEHKLVHGDHKAYVAATGKPAHLHYKVLEKKRGRSFLRIQLLTGRYHQIRVQLAAIGCPVVGDSKYGSRFKKDEEKIYLHHGHLQCVHPVTGESLLFEAAAPWAFS